MAVMAGKNGVIYMAGTKIGYIDNFSLNVNLGSAETSSLGDQWKQFIATCSDWSGSISGTLDYGDTEQKAIVDEFLNPSDAALALAFKVSPSLTLEGTAFYTSLSITGSVSDKVAVSFNFQGTGALAEQEAS